MKKIDSINNDLVNNTIFYAKSEANYTTLHFIDGTKIKLCVTMKRLLPQLKIDLLQINRGIAINTLFIDEYNVHARGGFITLSKQKCISILMDVSRRKAASVRKALKCINQNISQ